MVAVAARVVVGVTTQRDVILVELRERAREREREEKKKAVPAPRKENTLIAADIGSTTKKKEVY